LLSYYRDAQHCHGDGAHICHARDPDAPHGYTCANQCQERDRGMTDFTTLMASMAAQGDAYAMTATDDWLQGRTIYGGLAAAFCIEAAARQNGDLPPLRSAQFAFVGPATGAVTLRPTLLRRGKSTVFVGVDLVGEAGLATRATLCYGAPRTSGVAFGSVAAPTVPEPETLPVFFRPFPGLNFVQHFDSRLAAGYIPFSGDKEPTMTLWLRHRDDKTPASATALVALADAPPPAAIIRFQQHGPISTITWAIDLLTDRLETTDGWWLVRSTAETIMDGYSSQAMTVWNAARQPVMVCRQNIAVFV
jgi:acyl-CoA thioesterase